MRRTGQTTCEVSVGFLKGAFEASLFSYCTLLCCKWAEEAGLEDSRYMLTLVQTQNDCLAYANL